jgi:predicted TIM-barrel fold metal-dependent hydrolase
MPLRHVVFLSVLIQFSVTATTAMVTNRVIDSHLHIWADSHDAANAFPYAQSPPEALQNKGSCNALLRQMDANGVDGALIVQPINHKFDHSYVLQAIQQHPQRFKGMMLHDPDDKDPIARIEDLCLKGFVGVRFNPYLWPEIGEGKWKLMSEGTGLKVYKRCGELNMPVGIMCFQGLSLHYDDIVRLVEHSPNTICVLDHFGFTKLDDPESFEQLLSLAKYQQVHVKISALFRLGDSHPYDQVKDKRFLPLLRAFGSERLLYGSDFPYVLEHPIAYSVHKLVDSWIGNEEDKRNIMHGTAERLFGSWS